MSLGFVIAILISGFITGGLARLALPGPDPMPIWLTVAIGLVGSIVGAVVGDAISDGNGYVVSFLSFGVAIALVAAYRHFVQRRPISGPGALQFPERGLGVEQYRERLKQDRHRPRRISRPTRRRSSTFGCVAMLERAAPGRRARRRRARREARQLDEPARANARELALRGERPVRRRPRSTSRRAASSVAV